MQISGDSQGILRGSSLVSVSDETVHWTVFLNAKALGRRPTRDDHSAQPERNRERLHSEDSGRLAPEISEKACCIVARSCKSLYKDQNFPVLKVRFRSLVTLTPTTKESGRGG